MCVCVCVKHAIYMREAVAMACYVRRVQAGRQEHRRGYSARQRRILENIWHFFIKAFSFSRSRSSNSNDSDALYVVAVREI